MFKGYAHKDIFFSKNHDEFFVVTDPLVSVQDVVNTCNKASEVDVYPYGNFTIIESTDAAFAIQNAAEKEPADDDESHEINTMPNELRTPDNSAFSASKKFVCSLIAILMLLMPVSSVRLYAITGTLSDSQADISPLDGALFTTNVGPVSVNPAYADHSSGELAFTLRDPRPLGQTMNVRHQAVPAGLNARFIEAVLMYRKAHTLDDVQRLTGLVVTQAQLDAATQLSLWRHNLIISGNFHIQEASIQDAVVRSLSTQIDTWARSQLAVIPATTALSEAILPIPSPSLNTASVATVQDGTSTRIGPYVFVSNPITTLDISVTNGTIVNAAMQPISQVTTSEPFYVVIPQHITGRQTVSLRGHGTEYEFANSHGRVWLNPTGREISLNFSVGGEAGAIGDIQVTVLDSLTGLPMSNVHALIRTPTANFATMSTNDHGVMRHEVPVGIFWVDITSPSGFEPHPSFPMTISFIGDVQSAVITLRRTEAVVDFSIIDINTFAVLGYAEAFLYRYNIPYRRFAFTNGRVNGVLLSPGSYSISVYYTTGGYSISGQIPFEVIAGTNIEVAIPLQPYAPLTTIRLETTMNRAHWIFNFHRGTEFLFELPNNGMQQLRFPPGDNIQVIARSSDGTVHLAPFDFTTGIHDMEVMIPVVVGTETVTFHVVDNQVFHPIPFIVMGLFDQNHRLLDIQTADQQGIVKFAGLVYGSVYFVNVLGAPPEVSGYSANGNRFLGSTRTFRLQLYSAEYIRQFTNVDTIWRLPAVTYTGPPFTFPRREVPDETLLFDFSGSIDSDSGQ